MEHGLRSQRRGLNETKFVGLVVTKAINKLKPTHGTT
jgi:hypothetical protein